MSATIEMGICSASGFANRRAKTIKRCVNSKANTSLKKCKNSASSGLGRRVKTLGELEEQSHGSLLGPKSQDGCTV